MKATIALISCCVLVTAAHALGLVHRLDLTAGTLAIQQPWRLVTAIFLHLGAGHLLINAWGAWLWGPTLEKVLGRVGLVLLWLFSGAFGFLVSLVATSEPTCGASGAVAGLVGAQLCGLWQWRRWAALYLPGVKWTVAALVVWLLVGPLLGLDSAAHLGGLVAGWFWFSAVQPSWRDAP